MKMWARDDSCSYLNKGTVFELRDNVQVDFTENVTDIILIEGRVVDESTMNVFYAPYYLPKMARRLILPVILNNNTNNILVYCFFYNYCYVIFFF